MSVWEGEGLMTAAAAWGFGTVLMKRTKLDMPTISLTFWMNRVSAGLNVPQRFWKNQTVAGWNEVIRINLDGSYYCTAAVLPSMRARRDGLVINISSWSGRFDTFLTGPAYNAAKHAVVAMTAHLNEEECVNGIRACCICPAEVATPIMEKRPVRPSDEDIARMLQPEDLGRTIRWVAEQPPHVCVNEILISPTWNRIFLGAPDLKRS